ncbi:MAG: 3-keto-5-aminohexanoate cleavage protein [Candidatus Competibacterales bacterium]
MAAPDPVIITCAVTGAIHTPSMSPHLPADPEAIAASAVEAARAGAAILHIHARHPDDGRPSQDPVLYREILAAIKDQCDAVVNVTTGGSPHMSVEERLGPALALGPELASLNMGSMNFGLFPMLDRFREFRQPWERQHLENSKGLIFKNTFADIEAILTACGAQGTRFECECYDTGHLYNLKYCFDKGLIRPPLFVQTVFGILGGIGTHPEDVAHMKRTADRLFGDAYRWSVLGAGRHQMNIAATAAAMGGHVRVGLEDSLWIRPGELATSNAQQVHKVRQILEGLSLPVATPDQARQILDLKGRDAVGF